MRRLLALVAASLAVAAPAVAADAVEVADLLAAPDTYDGAEVTITGELVGDFQRRGDWTWVQLNGDSYVDRPVADGGPLTGPNLGIAVRFPSDAFDGAGFESPGGYRVRGPVVAVTGEWRHRDEDRGGESYLAAVSFEIIARERHLGDDPSMAVLLSGLGLLALAGLAAWFSRSRQA